MERNDVDCQRCGTNIFNGWSYWQLTHAFKCPDDSKIPHPKKYGNRYKEYNGHQFCPDCAEKLNYKCPICGEKLIKIKAWKR